MIVALYGTECFEKGAFVLFSIFENSRRGGRPNIPEKDKWLLQLLRCTLGHRQRYRKLFYIHHFEKKSAKPE